MNAAALRSRSCRALSLAPLLLAFTAAVAAAQGPARYDEFGRVPDPVTDPDLVLPDPVLDRSWKGPEPGVVEPATGGRGDEAVVDPLDEPRPAAKAAPPPDEGPRAEFLPPPLPSLAPDGSPDTGSVPSRDVEEHAGVLDEPEAEPSPLDRDEALYEMEAADPGEW